MDVPPVPPRSKHHDRRRSLTINPRLRQYDANRVSVQPASPEVISSLINTLSVISTPAHHLFENANGSLSMPTSPAVRTSFGAPDPPTYPSSARNSGGSFGVDYGAFNQPSLRELQEDEVLDELAASPPVIKTSKPPSGFSPLTAPKSSASRDSSPFKSFRRGTSRRSSLSSNDEVSSMGSPSIEPGGASSIELRKQSSGESWGKKQRGLMYMSSKERLREKEQERRLSSVNTRSADTLQVPTAELEAFMAQIPISEEPPTVAAASRTYKESTVGLGIVADRNAVNSGSPGMATGRSIPVRDSSLRNLAASKKRAAQRSSRQKDNARDGEGTDKLERRERRKDSPDAVANMTSSLDATALSPRTPQSPVFPQQSAGGLEREDESVAPSPAVAQRRLRASAESGVFGSTKHKMKPDVDTTETLKRGNSKLKRLSGPLSPPPEAESSQRSVSQPLLSRPAQAPEPAVQSQAIPDDRSSNADSIDDAVESYLRSPRLSQKVQHPPTGRVISFSEVGDPDGHVVFCCVGMGLTRYIMAFYDELALTLKLRLITPDRPGVGDSEAYTDGTATPLSWPDDVYTICQALKVTKFSILAHSAGAIYALATALRMPQHIRGRIHLLAPWIPPSQMSVIGGQQVLPPTNSIPTSQRILRALPTPMLKVANSSFMSATSSSLTTSLPKTPRKGKRRSTTSKDFPSGTRHQVLPGGDKENVQGDGKKSVDGMRAVGVGRTSESHVLDATTIAAVEKERQVTYDTRLTHGIWGLATTGANPAVDLLVCLERRHTIGFRYVDITRPVVIHHGSRDSRVPVENVKWLGKTMRKCEVRVLEGEGHGLMASAVVMGGVLTEISREWEDWVRVTTNKSKEDRSRTLRERASVPAFR